MTTSIAQHEMTMANNTAYADDTDHVTLLLRRFAEDWDILYAKLQAMQQRYGMLPPDACTQLADIADRMLRNIDPGYQAFVALEADPLATMLMLVEADDAEFHANYGREMADNR